MKPLRIVAFVHLASLAICVTEIHGGPLVGTVVTGSLKFGTDTLNAFDPAIKKAPAGFLNKEMNSLTVPISALQAEFGFKDSINAFSADFSDTQLIINATILTTSNRFTMTFTDDAFLGADLVKSLDTFISAGVTGTTSASISGTTITVVWPGTQGSRLNSTKLQAIFDINFPAAPDPNPAPVPIGGDPVMTPEPTSAVLFVIVCAASTLGLRFARRSKTFIALE